MSNTRNGMQHCSHPTAVSWWPRLIVALFMGICTLPSMAQYNNFATPRFIPKGPNDYDTTGVKRATRLSEESSGLLEREVDASTYVLGPNDVLTISVWASESVHLDLPITPEGKIVIPRAGVVSVKGLTLDKARILITEEMSKVYRSAKIDVSLKRLRQFKVYVLGAVRVPSVVSATAADHVFDVLQKAGGTLDTGSVRAITVMREGERMPLKVDLQRYLSNGDPNGNPTVLGGDRIIVPLRTHKNVIEISGEVPREGTYDFVEGDSVSTLIRFAGGFLPSGVLDSVLLVSIEDDGRHLKEQFLDLTSWRDTWYTGGALPGDLPLRSGDRLYIRAIPRWKERESVVIAGEVTYPGKYPVTPQVTRVTDVIMAAGGFTDKASIEDAIIIRTSELSLEDKEYERLKRLPPSEMSRNELQYYRTKSREVKGIMSVNFKDLFENNSKENNPVLRDGDSIYVPKHNLYVNVTGSVRNPGRIVYKPGLGYSDYISLAGGYGFRADEAATLVIKVKGDQFPADSKNYIIEPGDNILVLDEPETRFIDIFTTSLTVATQLVTIVGVVLTIVNLSNR